MTDPNRPSPQTPIAIIGMGCLFPDSPCLKDYWRLIRQGRDGITEVPPTHWSWQDYFDADPKSPDRTYAKRGGFLPRTPFDPTEFGIPPAVIEATDTAQLLGLVVAKATMEDAGYGPGREFNRERVSVLLGVTGTLELVIPLGARLGHPIWRKALQESGVDPQVAEQVVNRISDSYVSWQENSFPGLLGNVVAGRIANRLDLRGTNCAVDAACASTLGAVHLATLELTSGRSDMVLTGGVDTFNDIFMYMCFSKTPALSPTGDARPFSKDADGTILGEGIGMVLLKRLEDAQRDGDRIYAVIRGMGSSSDGRGQIIYAPNAEGQAQALSSAYAAAQISPATVELIEAHGTGTKVGDVVEFDALCRTFRKVRTDGTWCAVGSVKSQIGHTKAAAGAASLIKAALALHHRAMPPTIKVSEPNPKLDIEKSPFYLNTELRPWATNGDQPRRAGVSAFGFGGSNFHVVLEEPPQPTNEPAWDGSVEIIALSADSVPQLTDAVEAWRKAAADGLTRAELSIRADRSRREFSATRSHRLVLAVEADADLGDLLAKARDTLDKGPASARQRPNIYYGGAEAPGKLAFLFPGQGAQYVGMGRELLCIFPEALDALSQANAAEDADTRLSDRIYPPPVFCDEARSAQQAQLTRTDVAQPAIGAVSLACLRILKRFGIAADYTAGHSYGELVALCAAGRFDEQSLHRLSRLRGRLMAQGGGDRGAMLAVQAPLDDLAKLINDERIEVILANRNAPNQGVLSGRRDAIDRAAIACKTRGWQTTLLPVSAAFHSELVSDAQRPFRQALAGIDFRPGRTPVFANTTGKPYPDDPDRARDLLGMQLARPVDFVSEVENLYNMGVRTFVEVGPKAILTGLVQSILNDRPGRAMALDASRGRVGGLTDLARLLGQLAAMGYAVDLTRWERPAPTPRKPNMVIPLVGANYRAPTRRTTTQPKPTADGGKDRSMAGTIRPLPENGDGSVSSQADTSGNPNMRSNGQSPPDTSDGRINKVAQPPAPAPVDPAVARPSAPVPANSGSNMQVTPVTRATQASPALTDAFRLVQEGFRAMQALAQQTAEAHQRFLEGQEQAQKTFERILASQQGLIERSLGLPPSAPMTPTALPVSEPMSLPQSTPPPPPVRPVAPQAEVFQSPAGETPAPQLTPAAETAAPQVIEAPVAEVEQPAPAAPPAAEGGAFEDTLLSVVAELTGYPRDMLNLDMDMEEDLGIDSIKRVEILAAMEERLPQAKAVKPEYMGSLRTLRHVVEQTSQSISGSSAQPSAPPVQKPAAPVAQKPAATAVAEVATNVDRRVLRVVDLADPADGELSIAAGYEVWVTDDRTDLAPALAEKLAVLGLPSRIVSPEPPSTMRDTPVGGLIILGSPSLVDSPTWQAESEDFLKKAFLIAKGVGADLRAAAGKGGAFFATVSRMDGAFGLRGGEFDPTQGGLAGLTKTASHEWPHVRCHAIDVAPVWQDAGAVAAAILREIAADGPVEVGLDGNVRRGVEVQSAAAPTGPVALSENDVIIITGGARGVTAETALALAEVARPTLVLLGRSPAPTPEQAWLAGLEEKQAVMQAIRAKEFDGSQPVTPSALEKAYRRHMANREIAGTLRRLADAGSRATYRSVDVRDESALRRVLDEIRRTAGPIRGIIHGAGVIEDRRIEDKTFEQFEAVFDTKVRSLRCLLEVTAQDDLKCLVLFSSATARYGRQGQVDYAVANEVLNKVARQQAALRPGCRVVSINWGPWDGGMVDATLRQEFTRLGVGLIPLKAGGQCLVNELRESPGGPVEVLIGSGFESAAPVRKKSQRLVPASADFAVAFQREIDVKRYPFLGSHVIGGYPVMPFALILEWLGHGALHDNPGLVLHGLDDQRILKGVILSNGPETLRVAAGKARRTGAVFEVPVELRGIPVSGADYLHARATAILTTELPPAPAFEKPAGLDAIPYGRTVQSAYEDVLFHGPHFHAIEQIHGYSDQGLTATLRCGSQPSEWMTDPLRSEWLADPLVLDAGFQLGILWCYEEFGAAGLPSYCGRYRQYKPRFGPGPITAVLQIRQSHAHKVTGDLTFLDAGGAVVAVMEGCEWTVDKSLIGAFRQRTAVAAGR